MTKTFLLFLISLISLSAFAEIDLKNLDFTEKNNKGVLTINFTGNLTEYPELKVNQNSVYVVIPDSKVNGVINKKVQFATNGKDTKLFASQFKTNSTRVKTIVPYTIHSVKDQVALTIRDNKIELTFPKLKAEAKYLTVPVVKAVSKTAKPSSQVAKDLLNEDYLNSLIKQENKVVKSPTSIVRKAKIVEAKTKDEVKTALAAPKKSLATPGKSSFSFIEYGGKFVAFLFVVLALFWGVIALMKKGFIKRGKLGFLNNTDQVTILSQTYIAPKKSLMLIRAHNQVFLVSNTDSGIHPISEIKDVSGLIKNGEKIIAGNNFDDSLGNADTDEKLDEKIKLKLDITQSNKQSSLTDYLEVKEKVTFSDQLKKKVKNLKPLQ